MTAENKPRFFVSAAGLESGPFLKSKVQRMIRDGELPADALVRSDPSEEWKSAESVIVRVATANQKELLRFLGEKTPRGMSFDSAKIQLQGLIDGDPQKRLSVNLWIDRREKTESLLTYCAENSKVPPVSGLYLDQILIELQQNDPDGFASVSAKQLLAEIEKSHPMHTWRDDPASEAQIRLLKSKGVRLSPHLTKGEAYDLIGPLLDGATDGQKRRLTFYGIATEGVTKHEAMELIDEYIGDHPEAENAYQRWKANGEPSVTSQAPNHVPSNSAATLEPATLKSRLIIAALAAAAVIGTLFLLFWLR